MIGVDDEINTQMMQMMTDNQRTVFLKVLLFASKIDGHVDEQEVGYIKKIATKYKVSDIKRIFDPVTEEELLDELTCLSERKWGMELIKELFRLGYTDSNLTEEEIFFIGHVGSKLDIEKSKIEQISNWVIDYLVWKEQGKIIFEENA